MPKILFGPFRGLTIEAPRHSTKQVRYGLWERETYPFIRRAKVRAKWMIDAGAGTGEHAMLFARWTDATPIIAIEPQIHDALAHALHINGLSRRVRIEKQWLGRDARLNDFDVPLDAEGFIKIDVEGAERDVLRSGERLLKSGRPMLLIETHSAELERGCDDYLRGLGFSITIIRNAWWRLLIPERRPAPHNRWMWAEKRET